MIPLLEENQGLYAGGSLVRMQSVFGFKAFLAEIDKMSSIFDGFQPRRQNCEKNDDSDAKTQRILAGKKIDEVLHVAAPIGGDRTLKTLLTLDCKKIEIIRHPNFFNFFPDDWPFPAIL